MSTEVTTTRSVTVQGIAQRSWSFDAEPQPLPVESVTFSFDRRIGRWVLKGIVVRCYRGKGPDREIAIYHVAGPTSEMPLWLAMMAVEAAQESH